MVGTVLPICQRLRITGWHEISIQNQKHSPSTGSSLILMSPSRNSGLRSLRSPRSRSLSRFSRLRSERSRDRDLFLFLSLSLRSLRSRRSPRRPPPSKSSTSRSRLRRFLRSAPRDRLRCRDRSRSRRSTRGDRDLLRSALLKPPANIKNQKFNTWLLLMNCYRNVVHNLGNTNLYKRNDTAVRN